MFSTNVRRSPSLLLSAILLTRKLARNSPSARRPSASPAQGSLLVGYSMAGQIVAQVIALEKYNKNNEFCRD
jgi:hypothetical protein